MPPYFTAGGKEAGELVVKQLCQGDLAAGVSGELQRIYLQSTVSIS